MPDYTALTDHTVAVYKTHQEAEVALKVLQDSGHRIDNISIVGQEYATELRPIGFINTGDRMRIWGRYGAFWGAVLGLFAGTAMMLIPGIGYVMFAGYLVSALEGALVGSGLGILGAVLARIEIPENTVVNYEWALKEGGFMVVAHGNKEEAEKAHQLLVNTSPASIENYSARD